MSQLGPTRASQSMLRDIFAWRYVPDPALLHYLYTFISEFLFSSSKILMRWVANDIWFPMVCQWHLVSKFIYLKGMNDIMVPYGILHDTGVLYKMCILTLDFSQKKQLGCLSVFWLLTSPLFTASSHNQPRSWSQMTSVPNMRAMFSCVELEI